MVSTLLILEELVHGSFSVQISHKLLLKSLTSLKSATKSGTAEMKESGGSEGMVEALMDMALFCDCALRACEDPDEQSSPLDTDVSSQLIFL